MKRARIEIQAAANGGWYWHLRARNGEILCVSETFTREDDAKGAAKTARRTMALAKILTA